MNRAFAPLLMGLIASCTSATLCPGGTFDCVGRCLPFGSTCGLSDAETLDAGLGSHEDAGEEHASDASNDTPSDPCTSDDGVPVARYCRTAAVAHDCRNDTETTCARSQHCEDVLLRDRSAHQAFCLFDGSAPCDRSVDPLVTCAGSQITTCESTGAFDTASTLDCAVELGWEDATCVASGETFRCVAPEAAECAPSTSPSSCDGDRLVTCEARAFVASPVLTRRACGVGERCVESRRDAHGLCVGADAHPSGRAPSADARAERCLDETTVELEWEGFVYGAPCPITTHFTSMGEEVSVQTVCTVDGVGRYACIDPARVTACAATTSECAVDAGGSTVARTCVDQGDGRRLSVDRACSAATPEGTIATGCTAGHCDYVGACSAADAPACIDRYRLFCVEGRWAAESCASSCAEGACAM